MNLCFSNHISYFKLVKNKILIKVSQSNYTDQFNFLYINNVINGLRIFLQIVISNYHTFENVKNKSRTSIKGCFTYYVS